uniref:ATP synthase subunit b n=1 Tax=Hemiscolopendra marginata TaxID=943146 RepID=A0A646QIJ5_9MYRI
MLSRLALQSNFLSLSRTSPVLFRTTHHDNVPAEERVYKQEPLKIKEHPERDLVNFPRIKRPEYPGKVRMGFVPEEWFQFFYNKTGVTGPYVFAIGLTTYLVSKEIYVLEHEFYTGVSLFIMAVYGIKTFGPKVAAYLDKEIDTLEEQQKDIQAQAKSTLQTAINDEEKSQTQAKGMMVLFNAKRENVLLQLEASFRERQMMVYEAVKRRLDYQLEKQNAQRRMEQKHMVNWIVNSVMKSITAQQEKEALQKCISDLKSLASKAKAM